jgi:hypothetical protein
MKEDLRRRSSSSSSIDVVLVIDIDIIFVRLRIEQTCDRGGHGCHDRLSRNAGGKLCNSFSHWRKHVDSA